jgi:hypothetical protein
MAKLKAKSRKRLKGTQFVYPKTRSYPIHDKAHAKAALRLGAQSRTKGSISTIRRKVYKKYPSLRRKRKK